MNTHSVLKEAFEFILQTARLAVGAFQGRNVLESLIQTLGAHHGLIVVLRKGVLKVLLAQSSSTADCEQHALCSRYYHPLREAKLVEDVLKPVQTCMLFFN